MAQTTWSGPIRTENGFQIISKSATTGAETVTAQVGTGTGLMTAGTGVSTGVGTVYKTSVSKNGDLIHTKILIDLTGLNCGGTAADIIGVDAAANCHFGQVTAAVNGTVYAGKLTCYEAPTGGNADVDVYSATESTGTEDAAVTDLTETQLVNGAAQTKGKVTMFTAVPAADEYIYLACGTSTDATFTAGILMIDLFGYAA